jgi:hypothetical protein
MAELRDWFGTEEHEILFPVIAFRTVSTISLQLQLTLNCKYRCHNGTSTSFPLDISFLFTRRIVNILNFDLEALLLLPAIVFVVCLDAVQQMKEPLP